MNYKTLDDIDRVIALRKNSNVIDVFVESYLQGQSYQTWLDARKAEHAIAYPELVDGDPVYDTDGTTILFYEQIPNPAYIDFETWMQETQQVQIGTRDVYDTDGITVIGTEPIYEDQLIREYTEVNILQTDIDAFKTSHRVEKRVGVDYNGTLIPFMNEDAVAMLQVKAAFELGETSTNIEFSNGVIFPITATDFPAFASWFVQHRNSYFL